MVRIQFETTEGSADVYICNEESVPSEKAYRWKLCSDGNSVVCVSPSDKEFSLGQYYFCVVGREAKYKSMIEFSLTVTTKTQNRTFISKRSVEAVLEDKLEMIRAKNSASLEQSFISNEAEVEDEEERVVVMPPCGPVQLYGYGDGSGGLRNGRMSGGGSNTISMAEWDLLKGNINADIEIEENNWPAEQQFGLQTFRKEDPMKWKG